MIELDYNETVTREMSTIPLSYHNIDATHPKYHMALHFHRPYEIFKVISGKIKVFLNNESIIASAGDVVFVGQEMIHGYIPLNLDCRYKVINFDVFDVLARTHLFKKEIYIFDRSDILIKPFISHEAPYLIETIDRLFNLASKQTTNCDLMVFGTLLELLGSIYYNNLYSKTSNDSAASSKVFKPLLEYIKNNYMKPISLADMAKVSKMSVSHFAMTFRKFFAQTPIDFLNSYRIEHACLLLSSSDLSITDIAYRCGYNDSSYFVKVFKKYKNITPKKYREFKSFEKNNTEKARN